jgi:putative ABC transport system ATP-binding protein
MALLERLSQQGITIVMVTHESDIAGHARRLVQFRDGRIVRDEPTRAGGVLVGGPR